MSKKSFSLLNKTDIEELGRVISTPNRPVLNNPISDAINIKARQHMVIANDMDITLYEDEQDSEVNQGSFSSPVDKTGNATQSTDYVIEPPSAFSRLFAVQNLPIAHRITFGVATDCWKSGDQFPFNFAVPKDIEVETVDWSNESVKVLRDIGFFRSGPQHMGIGEMDGESLLILLEEGFDWGKTDVAKPRDTSKRIIDTISIPMFYVYRGYSIKEWTNEGLPRFWYINVNSIDGFSRQNAGTFKFHHSRIIHHCPEPLDTSTKGLCTLIRSWQALCIGFNIDIGIGEAFFRWGIGHPVFETEYDSIEDLKAFMSTLGSPNRRTWHALLRGMKLTFAGAAGTALDFSAGKEVAVYDEISIATGIPRPILKGEVAGVQTGSEVNERTYWGILRQKQTAYNQVIWKLLGILNETGQTSITGLTYDPENGVLSLPENVIVKWTVHYVETEEQRVDILIKKLNALNPLKDLLTINELRALIEDIMNVKKGTYPALPAPVGNQILSIYSDPFEMEQSLAEQQLSQTNLPTSPKKSPSTKPTGELKGNSPTEKLTSLTGKGNIPPVPSIPSKPRPIGEVGAPKKPTKDVRYPSNKIVGCPDHPYFHRSCPACLSVLNHKENIASDLLHFGFSVNDVQNFTNLDRNKVNIIRQKITLESREKKENGK